MSARVARERLGLSKGGLARALILELSEPDDTVLDPFCGGGTTAIEALAHGRRAISGDLSPLACHVTRAKAWPLTERSMRSFARWVEDAARLLEDPSRVGPVPLVTGAARPRQPRG